jgi:hypothetical protein
MLVFRYVEVSVYLLIVEFLRFTVYLKLLSNVFKSSVLTSWLIQAIHPLEVFAFVCSCRAAHKNAIIPYSQLRTV